MNEPIPTAERLVELFNQAKALPVGERAQFLDQACGDDSQMRAELNSLLQAGVSGVDYLGAGPAVSPQLEAEFARLKPEEPGEQIGHYNLLQQIGEGGFGVVWMAEQNEPVKRRVALKIIKLGMDTKEVIARFEQERQALAMMDHPNIARVFDAGATPTGRPYFVMELIRGIKITEYCDQANLATTERLQLFIAVCHAVQHAHQKGIIHRDLKPSNILVTLHDGLPVPKVIDFGVAKATQSQKLTELTLLTQFEQMIGTPLYMSPEQAEMSGLDIDTRSDIYSLGVLLYELLVGRTPFDPERVLRAGHDEIRRLIREEDPPKPSTALSTMQPEMRTAVARHRSTDAGRIARLLRGDLDWIVMKALEKDRARRYETANGFAADVQRYLSDETVAACPPSAAYRLRKFARRNKGALAAAALVLFSLVLAGSGVGWALRDRTARHARVAGQVESILTEVDQLLGKQKWREALNAARRAEAALTGGEADVAAGQRVRERLKELEFIDRLERIRMQWATWIDEKFDYAGADREYARAFREYGVDVQELAPETAINRLRARSALAVPVAAALDDWVSARRNISSMGIADWEGLVAVARAIDSQPLRNQLRAISGQPVAEAKEELQRLVESIDLRAQHPVTLQNLASSLDRVKLRSTSVRLQREAQYAYPEDFWLSFSLAQRLEREKDYEGAVRFYTAAVSIRPNAVAALNNLGNCLQHQGKVDEGTVAYRKSIEVDPNFAYGYLSLARTLRDQGQLDEAIAAYRKGIELLPKRADGYFRLGGVLSQRGRHNEAIAAYRKAIEVDPKHAPAYEGLALALRDQGNVDEAIAALHKAIELDPQRDAESYRRLGSLLKKQNKVDEAIVAYRKAVELDPKSAGAFVDIGIALHDQKRHDEAIDFYRKAIEVDPKNAVPYLNVGIALWDQHKLQKANAADRAAIELKLDEAIAAFRKAIERDPKDSVAYYYLGIALQDQAKFDDAISAFQKAIELDPKSVAPYMGLGALLCCTLKEHGRATEYFHKAIELDPTNAMAYGNLSCALLGQGKTDEALVACRNAGKFAPGNPGVYAQLGDIFSRLGKTNEALAALKQALEIEPQSASAHNDIAWLLATCPDPKFRDPNQALALAKKAVALDPTDGGYLNTLGAAYYRKGDWKAALVALEKSMNLRSGGDSVDWFFIAMSNWQLGNKDEARRWHDKAVDWMEKNAPADEQLIRFGAEAGELLGVKAKR